MWNNFVNLFSGEEQKEIKTEESVLKNIQKLDPGRLQMYCDDGLGSVHKLYAFFDDRIHLLTTRGVYCIPVSLTEPIYENSVPDQFIDSLDYHPQQGYVAIYQGKIYRWDREVKELLCEQTGFRTLTMKWSPDGTKLLTGWAQEETDWDGKGHAVVYDPAGNILWEKKNSIGWMSTVAWGKTFFAIGNATGDVRIYDLNYKEIRHLVLNGLNPMAEVLQFDDQDHLQIISVDDNERMKFICYNPVTDDCETLLKENIAGHEITTVHSLGWLAFMTGEKTENRKPGKIYLSDIHSMTEKSVSVNGVLKAMTFLPGGKTLALIDEDGIRTVAVKNGRKCNSRTLESVSIGSPEIVLSDDPAIFATKEKICISEQIVIWSGIDGKVLKKIVVPPFFNAVFLSNKQMALSGNDGLYYLDIETGKVSKDPVIGEHSFYAIRLLSDKKTLALGTYGRGTKNFILYNMTDKSVHILDLGQNKLKRIYELPDYNSILLGFEEGNLWNCKLIPGKGLVYTETAFSYDLHAYTFSVSAGEKYFFWTEKYPAEKRNVIYITDEISDEFWQLEDYSRNKHDVLYTAKCIPSPDNSRVLISSDATVILDLETLQEKKELRIYGICAWHPGGDYFVIGGAQDTDSEEGASFTSQKLVFYTATGDYITEYQTTHRISDVRFTPDGNCLIVANNYGKVYVFRKPD